LYAQTDDAQPRDVLGGAGDGRMQQLSVVRQCAARPQQPEPGDRGSAFRCGPGRAICPAGRDHRAGRLHVAPAMHRHQQLPVDAREVQHRERGHPERRVFRHLRRRGTGDVRQVEAALTARGDKQYLGIAQIWEVLDIAVAADIYGDVPYREAVSNATTPHLDPQAQVYADLQGLLDQAITNLGGPGPGPGILDLVYQGNTSKWIDAANTIKARLFMHTVETPTGFDAGALNNAITYGLNGIKASANDLNSVHTTNPGEDNLWFQFYARSGFGQYVVAGQNLADLMVARNDTFRLR